ncbi:MAG: PAS domain S-box protein [Deltaproteobacteria bacterium]|nr:PAS domain S-box protein [Deltaproteobacteria bacterium]
MKNKLDSPEKNHVNRYICLFIFIWTAAIAISLAWNADKIKEEYLTIIQTKARDILQTNRIYRRWNASVGGVYVNVTPRTPPNSHLSHVPERDIVPSSGKTLTLINPAYMSRLVFETHFKDINIMGRITGINPLNPSNAPDDWEKAALSSFREGKNEVSTIEKIGTESYIRLMIPFYTEQSCLKCHPGTGHKVGDLQGGINVTFPVTALINLQQDRIITILYGHGIFFIVGFWGIIISGKRIANQIRKIRESEERYRKVFETNQAIKFVIDASDGSIVEANEAASTFYGYTIDELTEKKINEINILNSEDLQQVLDDIVSEKKLSFIFKHRLASGEMRDVEVFSSPIQLAGKTFLYSIIHDITERNRAIEALKEAYESVEYEVKERTAQLTIANELLNKTNISLQWELNVSQSLSELYEKLTSPDSTVVDMANKVLNSSILLTGSRYGYVSSIDPITGDNIGHTMTEMMVGGCNVSPENQRIAFPCNKNGIYGGLWGHSLNTLQGFFTNSPYAHESSKGIPEGHIRLENFLSMPVLGNEKLLGQIALANKNGGFSENDFQAVKRISNYYALVLQRKMSEEALIESERKFRSIFDNSFDAIMLTVPDGHILAANQSACRLVGRTEEEICLVGREGLVDVTDPNLMPALDRRAKNGKVYAELTMLRQDGSKFTGEITSNVFHDRDGKDKSIIIIRDITQRKMMETALKESEEKFAKTFKYAPLLMTISNIQDGRYIDVNEKFSEVTGFTRDEAIGKTSVELGWMSKGDRIKFVDILNRAGRIESMELSLTSKDKKSVVCLYAEEIIIISGLKCLLSIAQDITQRKQLETDLLRAKEAAQYANQAKSEFLANMSHEIRTPMNSVMGFADLLIKSQLDSKQLEFASAIKQASGNLMFILNDILDLSKIEAGKLELEPITFNLDDLCDQVIDTFEVIADKTGIRLSLEISPELHVNLHGDPNRLRQILHNLVGNAVKFTSSGSVELVVTPYGTNLSFGETHTVVLIFAVKDTGIGVPVEQRERIFDPFTQVDASTRRRYGGTGLGLNICKKLVELMGGEIWIKSTVGVGSTFYFTACFESVHDSESPSIGKGKEQPISLRPLRILLAEDDALNQRFATEVLINQGHSVEIAMNGKEVINKLRVKPFDLILMDISMPDMDGTEVTKVIRGSTLNIFDSKIPIIAQTAHALKGDKERFLEAGMDGYITKPIDIDELSAVIRQVVPHFVLKDGAGEDEDRPSEATDETLPVFDNKALKTRFSGKEDLLGKLFEMFVEDIPNKISDLDSSMDHGGFKALFRLAHTLKGSAATLAATALNRCAANLEKCALEEDLEAVKLHFPKLKAEMERLRAVSLEQLLARLNE